MSPLGSRRRRPLRGAITMPGDKSISHRALLIAGITDGRSTIAGLNDGEDVARTRAALDQYGVTVRAADDEHQVEVQGSPWTEPADVIDAGNSGSTARMLAGAAATLDGCSVITGDASLRRRPMLRVVAPLRAMGATIDGRRHADRLPLIIRGGSLVGADHELAVASAQVKTALLFAGLRAEGRTSVTEPGTSRDHTERMLAAAGADVEVAGPTVSLSAAALSPVDWQIPGDISSAFFFIVAATLLADSALTVNDVGLNPTRTGALDVLHAMGADISLSEGTIVGGEPRGSLRATFSALRATTVTRATIPRLVDEVPILAIAATQAVGTTVFDGLAELRVKESDRVEAIATGITGIGGHARAEGDVLEIEGPTELSGGSVDSRGDHRIAMAFAIAGLLSAAPVKVQGWSCVDTSFPTFLDVLARAQGGAR